MAVPDAVLSPDSDGLIRLHLPTRREQGLRKPLVSEEAVQPAIGYWSNEMSTTTSTQPAFPASPVTPAAPSVSGDIALAAGATNLVARAEANPELMAWLQTQFGSQMAAAQKSPVAWIAGLGIGWLFSRYGIQADATAQSLLSVLSAVLAGDVWQWASAKWWPVKAPPTPAAP